MKALELTPVSFADACAFVALHHRHNQPPVGHKFSIGVESRGQLVGVAMVGRPVARMLDDGQNLENRAGAQSNSKTGIRGVSVARNGKFRGRVKHNGKCLEVGTFLDIRDAEAAVIAKRNELFTHNNQDRARAAEMRLG